MSLVLLTFLVAAAGSAAAGTAALVGRVTAAHSVDGAGAASTRASGPLAGSAPAPVGGRTAVDAAAATSTVRVPAAPRARPNFDAPVFLPGSATTKGEPSLTLSKSGTYYVVGVAGVGTTSQPSAPLWKSGGGGGGGRSWSDPIPTANVGSQETPLGGGDSDIVIDNAGNIFVTDLWLGNTSMSVSTDGGTTWKGIPIGHPLPNDDRPWFAYDPKADAMYMLWDQAGVGLKVGKAILRGVVPDGPGRPVASMEFAQEVVAVPETVAALPGKAQLPAGTVPYTRERIGPPGTITVDPQGNVYFAYGDQNGVAIAGSTDGGLTWTHTNVPHSGIPGNAATTNNVFQVLRSDSDGNLYVTWSQPDLQTGDMTVFYSFRRAGDGAWHAPVPVSTGAAPTALFPTLAVVRPGVVDIAYYGAPAYEGDNNTAPRETRWDLYMAQSSDALGTPHFLTATAVSDVHHGNISTQGLTGGGDRSLGDFFSMVVDKDGLAGIVTSMSHGSAVEYAFLHQSAPFIPMPPQPPADQCVAGTSTLGQVCVLNCPPFCSTSGQSIPGYQNPPQGGSNGVVNQQGPAQAVSVTQPTPAPSATPLPDVVAKLGAASIHDPVERTGASGMLAAIIAGALLLLFGGAAVLTRVRR
jgi:hypothetical protein